MSKKPQIESALEAALDVPEVTSPPGREAASSFSTQVASLKPGATAARAVVVASTLTVAEWAERNVTARENLRDSVTSSVRIAKGRFPDRTFDIHVGDLITTGKAIYTVAVVTRTDDNE